MQASTIFLLKLELIEIYDNINKMGSVQMTSVLACEGCDTYLAPEFMKLLDSISTEELTPLGCCGHSDDAEKFMNLRINPIDSPL